MSSVVSSIKNDASVIESEGRFLIEKGYVFSILNDYVTVFSTIDIDVECVYERYGMGVWVNILLKNDQFPTLPNGDVIRYSVLWLASKDDKTSSSRSFNVEVNSMIDNIKKGLAIIKEFPEKFLNPDYLLHIYQENQISWGTELIKIKI